MAQRTSQGVMDGGSALPSGTAQPALPRAEALGRRNPDQRAPSPALAREDRPLRYPAQAPSPADPCNKVISDASKADRIASATRRTITEKMEEDPALYRRVSEML